MATIPGTYVRTGLSTNSRVNAITDVFLASSLTEFRQITIYHEKATKLSNTVANLTYHNWNPDYAPQVYLNNNPNPVLSTLYTVDYLMGKITFPTMTIGDNLLATYNFDYFPIYVIEGFMARSIDVINVAPTGALTDYDITNAPTNWDGIIADLTFAMCMEKLILDYDLWKGRLIFAIGPQNLIEGGGDVVAQLETLKRNAEDRAYKAFDNPYLKSPHHLSKPTQYYYDSMLVGGSSRGQHGLTGMGKLRGLKISKYMGRSLS